MRSLTLIVSATLHATVVTVACLVGGRWSASEAARATWIRIQRPESIPADEVSLLEPEVMPPEVAPAVEPPPAGEVTPMLVPRPEPLRDTPSSLFEPDPPPPAPWTAGVANSTLALKVRVAHEPAPAPALERTPQAAEDVDAVSLDEHNPPPPYPYPAWLRRQQGTVQLELEIDAGGTVTTCRVVRSSGWPMLDAAAQRALCSWHFRPALRNGIPTASIFHQAVVFRIDA